MSGGTTHIGLAPTAGCHPTASHASVLAGITADLEAIVERMAPRADRPDSLGEILERVSWSLSATVRLADLMGEALEFVGAQLLVAARS